MPAINVNIQPEVIHWALSQTQESKLGDKLMKNIKQSSRKLYAEL